VDAYINNFAPTRLEIARLSDGQDVFVQLSPEQQADLLRRIDSATPNYLSANVYRHPRVAVITVHGGHESMRIDVLRAENYYVYVYVIGHGLFERRIYEASDNRPVHGVLE
jgi:hypothetical protein